jgi:vitamin B12 transporter
MQTFSISVSIAAIAAALSSTAAWAVDDETGGDIIVTASRSGDPEPIDNIGASATLLDAQALDQRQTRIVSDILRDVPGVAVSRTGAIGGLTQVRIRGSEANHVLVLIDGIEVSDPYQGEYDFGTLIADPDARVEVLRGQQSSLYGSDAIGGVIQYITASGRETPGIALRAEGGSFDTASTAARIGGTSGTADYALTGSYYHTGGSPTAIGGTRDVGSDSAGAGFKLNWQATGNFKLTAVGRYSYTDADTNDTDYDPTSPTFGYLIDSPGVRTRNQAFYGLIRGQLDLLDGRWTSGLQAQIADTKRDGFAGSDRTSGDKGTRYKGSFDSTIRFGEGSVKHRVTVAVDAEREEYQNTTPDPFGFTFNGRRSTENLGLVGEYGLNIGDAFAAGASIRRDFNNRFADSTTYRAQASYRFDTGTRIHAAAGSGMKNPGFFELFGYDDGRYIGNPNLKPERSEGWEAGIEQAFGSIATIGATWFDNRLKDEIYTTYPAPDFVATPANRTTKSKQRGLETYLSAHPTPQVRIDAAYTWLHAREDGLEEVRRPKNIASINLSWTSKDDRFTATATARYNGQQTDLAYTDPSFIPLRVKLKDYTLVNLVAEYRLTKTLALFGRVENLFDDHYEEIFGVQTQGRGAYAGVRARF